MPKLSIITPVLNGKRFIEYCLKNVIEQNCPEAEHIIVDGGSTDGTVEIIKKYTDKYPHIRWISKKDKGQSDALNKGIEMAKGEIIGILNYDDFYERDTLNRIIRYFEKLPKPSLLVGNCKVWKSEGQLLYICKPKRLRLADLLLGFQVNPHPINPSSYFYHKSLHQIIGPYDQVLHYNMDQDFIFKAVQVAHVKYIDETWGNFREFPGTKTFYSVNSGLVKDLDERILKFYRKDLPFFQRMAVSVEYRIYRSRLHKKLKYVWGRLAHCKGKF